MKSDTHQADISPFSIPNIRLFIAFKVLFNSRFYYPVFTILFLDFGLTVAEFSILNALWAATIVLAEVPSGALADIFGRKKLLVLATMIMVVEIGIISFVPRISPSLIFIVFSINRILSGLAEASASGADEALAYDSLVQNNLEQHWGKVLAYTTRFQSIGFIISMSIGAAVYDPALLEKILTFMGVVTHLTQETTMRFPLYLTFIMSIFALITTLQMKDVNLDSSTGKALPENKQVKHAFSLTLKAGIWILKTPFVFVIILFGMLFDGIIRVVITLSSQYYRLIELPESVFGIIGSTVAMLGLFIPGIANKIATTRSPSFGLWVTFILSATGLFGMSRFWPYSGLIPALITFSAMYFTGFFVSYYVNQATASEQRATILSFKGLSYNISYGVLGILYALLLKFKKENINIPNPENIVFMDTFVWFPGTFMVLFILLLLLYVVWFKKKIAKI
ncbi:MFS transporter [Desulfobacterales bacterium HSG16]|nr:MFS transporter [Desulfobacterales bacterium HSG16]